MDSITSFEDAVELAGQFVDIRDFAYNPPQNSKELSKPKPHTTVENIDQDIRFVV